MKVMYNFVAANRVRQSVCLKNQTEQMDNHFVTFICFTFIIMYVLLPAGEHGSSLQNSNNLHFT